MTTSQFQRLVRTSVVCICFGVALQLQAANSVAVENTNPGTSQWRLSNPASMGDPLNQTGTSYYAAAEIQGYASRTSVNQGQSIDFYVRTINTNPYTLAIYRLGWYGGFGGRLMLGPITLDGVVQPMPPPPVLQPAGTGLVECDWSASYSLTIPTDWVSGIYLAKLSLSSPAKESWIIFVVRDDNRSAPILYSASFATYQAYNEWGGSSLYTTTGNDADTGPRTGYKVSFNRPFWRDSGAGDFMRYEIGMVRWLEKQGYEVTYSSDIDTHQNPNALLSHKVFLLVGHSEYWSWDMRANVERARDTGVNIGIFTANTCYAQIRFEPSTAGEPDRTEIAYKDELASLDHPSDARYMTGRWRNTRPEEAFVGVQYNGVSDMTPSDIVVTDASHWLFNGSGLSNGGILPNILGYETDSMFAYYPAGTTSVAHSPFPKGAPRINADVSIYTAPSAAMVFSSGSIFWAHGLDDYPNNYPATQGLPGAQQVTANFFARALQTSKPINGRLPATASASSETSFNPASNAGDGNYSTQWVASVVPSNNAWIQLDLGVRRWIRTMKWVGSNGSPVGTGSPTNYSLQISDDGTNWQTIIVRVNSSPVVNGSEPLNEQARYVRLTTTKVGGGTLQSLSLYEFWAEGTTPLPSGRLKTFATQANAQASGYPAAQATDLDTGTQWVASLDGNDDNNNNAWIQWDLGSKKQIDKIKWSAAVTEPYPAFAPTNYNIQVSDDAVSWKTILTKSNSSPVIDGSHSMSAQGRYVKLTTTKVGDGTGWSLSFFEIWAQGSDASNILGANASASSEDASYPASNAVDGSNSTQWMATSPDNNAWIRLDFGSVKQINKVRWLGANQVPAGANSPTNYSVQVSDDGTNWTSVLTKTHSNRVIVGDELLNVQARYLRLVTTKVGDGSGWALSLFEFWAEGY